MAKGKGTSAGLDKPSSLGKPYVVLTASSKLEDFLNQWKVRGYVVSATVGERVIMVNTSSMANQLSSLAERVLEAVHAKIEELERKERGL